VHFGKNAESMMAPDIPRLLSLKSATGMVVSIVTDLLSSPLKVKFVNVQLLYRGITSEGEGVVIDVPKGVFSDGTAISESFP
jgi:hypothetical protein